MTTISAKIIADNISPQGKRLTTMQLRYPRYIHAESKTHRFHAEDGEVIEEFVSPGVMNDPNLSRNARSSRAVPVPKMIQEAIDDPVIPIHWGAAQRGMQAYEECDNLVEVPWTDFEQGDDGRVVVTNPQHDMPREQAWLWARDRAVDAARAFHKAGYAKQLVNRLLEPFLHIDTLVSATEWDNFFALRDHHAAEPHIKALARAMKHAMSESTPKLLRPGDWHLPYIDDEQDRCKVIDYIISDENGSTFDITPSSDAIVDIYRKLSVARSARISYAPFDGDASIKAELKRYDLLVGSTPLHASPAEHIATPDELIDKRALVPQFRHPELSGNFGPGWIQHRKLLPGEAGPVAF